MIQDLKIPTILSQLTSLQFFDLTGFTGPIPDWIGTSFVNLTSLTGKGNYFTGEIPSSFGNLKNLQTLYLNDNRLSGVLPDFLSNITDLEYLDLSNNNITGTVPDSWSRLNNLYELNLSGNCITGSLPTKLSQRGFTLGTQCGIAPTDSLTTTGFRTPTITLSVTPTNTINNNGANSNSNDNMVAIAAGSAVGGVLLVAWIVVAKEETECGELNSFMDSLREDCMVCLTYNRVSVSLSSMKYGKPEFKPNASIRVLVPNHDSIPPTNLQPGTPLASPTYLQPMNGGYIHSIKPGVTPTGGYIHSAAAPVSNGNSLLQIETGNVAEQSTDGDVDANKEAVASVPVSSEIIAVTLVKKDGEDDGVGSAVVVLDTTSNATAKTIEDASRVVLLSRGRVKQ
ncbi:hypothetical protein HDU76_008825 [Blyttiomyces sp. JEL0837]|nr:hypothetical protein HDU76_008825 [Blyttiomyces sp. JEL0837]